MDLNHKLLYSTWHKFIRSLNIACPNYTWSNLYPQSFRLLNMFNYIYLLFFFLFSIGIRIIHLHFIKIKWICCTLIPVLNLFNYFIFLCIRFRLFENRFVVRELSISVCFVFILFQLLLYTIFRYVRTI